MKSFTAGPLVVKQTFSKSIQLNSIGWPHRDKTLLGIREPLVIPAIYVIFLKEFVMQIVQTFPA